MPKSEQQTEGKPKEQLAEIQGRVDQQEAKLADLLEWKAQIENVWPKNEVTQ